MEWKEYAEKELKQLHVYRKQQLLDWPLVKGAINCAVVSCPVVRLKTEPQYCTVSSSPFQHRFVKVSNHPDNEGCEQLNNSRVASMPRKKKKKNQTKQTHTRARAAVAYW